MKTKDIPSVCALERLSFSNPWSESTFRGEIQNRPFSFPYVIVHRKEDRVIGYLLYWQIKEQVFINNLAVHPDFRRQGIAEAVLEKVLSKLSKEGAEFVSLEVRPSNSAALSLYKKLGFRLVGVRKNYYIKPHEDAIIFGKNLE